MVLEGVACADVVARTSCIYSFGQHLVPAISTNIFVGQVNTFEENRKIVVNVIAGIKVKLMIRLDIGWVSTNTICRSRQIIVTPVIAQTHLNTIFVIERDEVCTVTQASQRKL